MLDALTNRGDVTLLPEVHMLSSALKVKSSWDCTPGSEEARKSMGGHGYSHLAGVGTIFADQAPAQTYEGDNYVISQQVARALVKSVLLLKQRPDAKLPESFSYIRLAVDGKRIARDNHLHFLHARAVSILITLAEAVVANPQMSWTDHSWASARLAAAHADVFVVSKLPETPLSSLHTLSTLVAALPELLEAGVVMTPQAAKALRKAQEDAVDALSLGDVIRLTDAFEFHDWELPGVVGASDGRVYERMLEMAVEWDVSLGEHGEELRRRALEISNHSKQAKSAKL
jgi:acyl-CoA oxidase